MRAGLALRYSWKVWTGVWVAFLIIHYLLFGIVHNYVDMRPTIGYSPDPVMKIIPFDPHWSIISINLYIIMIAITTIVMLTQAVRGVHTPLLRIGLALCFHTTMRMFTLLMIPLTRPNLASTAPPLKAPEMLNLGFTSIPWRVFALNDLVYSGHTSLFLMVLFVTGTWPRIWRWAVGVFLVAMVYALLATRDHYSIDILLAIPCAYFSVGMATAILRRLKPRPRLV